MNMQKFTKVPQAPSSQNKDNPLDYKKLVGKEEP
jgi:hypothetical protein